MKTNLLSDSQISLMIKRKFLTNLKGNLKKNFKYWARNRDNFHNFT